MSSLNPSNTMIPAWATRMLRGEFSHLFLFQKKRISCIISENHSLGLILPKNCVKKWRSRSWLCSLFCAELPLLLVGKLPAYTTVDKIGSLTTCANCPYGRLLAEKRDSCLIRQIRILKGIWLIQLGQWITAEEVVVCKCCSAHSAFVWRSNVVYIYM